MNPLRRFSLTFGSILLLGALVFIYQTRRLTSIEHHMESRSAATATSAPPPDETLHNDQPVTKPAVATPQPDTDSAEKFIGKLKAALASSLNEVQLATFLNVGGKLGSFEALASAANLTLEESATVREGLEKFDEERAALFANHAIAPAALTTGLADVKLRQDQWLAGQLGTERYAALTRYEERRTRESAKQRAAEAVSRIAAATDLTEEQKEKLNEGFLELSLRPPQAAAENKLVVETTGNLNTGPTAPDLSEDAEKILTPAQLENYQLQQQAAVENTEAKTEAMMEMMQTLLPAVIQLLENDGQ